METFFFISVGLLLCVLIVAGAIALTIWTVRGIRFFSGKHRAGLAGNAQEPAVARDRQSTEAAETTAEYPEKASFEVAARMRNTEEQTGIEVDMQEKHSTSEGRSPEQAAQQQDGQNKPDAPAGPSPQSGGDPFVQDVKTMQTVWTQAAGNIWLRALFILFIILLLGIPRSFVGDIVYERSGAQQDTVNNIAASWGYEQLLTGPALVIPYDVWEERQTSVPAGEGKVVWTTTREKSARKYRVLLPTQLDFKAEIIPHHKYYGIYTYTVYESPIAVAGTFILPDENKFGPDLGKIYWEDAVFALGISSPASIGAVEPLIWNGVPCRHFKPGTTVSSVLPSGYHTDVSLRPDQKNTEFSLKLTLKGSKRLFFGTAGELTTIEASGKWRSPSFQGYRSPEFTDIREDSFTARWSIPNVSRSYPQFFEAVSSEKRQIAEEIQAAGTGLDLHEPVSLYRKVTRSIKYSTLFVGLTFIALFCFELSSKARLHFLQYGLVGLSMMVFYLALLSLAEHCSFPAAFFIAALLTVLMNSAYIAAAMRSLKQGLSAGGILAALYIVLYCLLGMEEYALLVGTALVLVVLGVLMYVTRNLAVAQKPQGAGPGR